MRQEPECCEVCHVAVCCMSMICNVQTQGSVGSPSVKKIVGLYMCCRSGSDWVSGVHFRQLMGCVLIVGPPFFWLQWHEQKNVTCHEKLCIGDKRKVPNTYPAIICKMLESL